MDRSNLVAAFLLLALLGVGASAQEPAALPSWFPPEALDGAAAQLAVGMAHLEDSEGQDLSDPARRHVAARRGVLRIAGVVDEWGVRGLVVRTPRFLKLDVPRINEPLVSTLSLYGVCSLGLYPELAKDDDERFYVALGEVTVGVISMFLRAQYLAQGGTEEELKRLLSDPGWRTLARQIAEDGGKRGHVNENCAPVISAMVERKD